MGAIRGVLFDLDGVLVSTDELHYQSWRRIADAEGIWTCATSSLLGSQRSPAGADRTTSPKPAKKAKKRAVKKQGKAKP